MVRNEVVRDEVARDEVVGSGSGRQEMFAGSRVVSASVREGTRLGCMNCGSALEHRANGPQLDLPHRSGLVTDQSALLSPAPSVA